MVPRVVLGAVAAELNVEVPRTPKKTVRPDLEWLRDLIERDVAEQAGRSALTNNDPFSALHFGPPPYPDGP